MYKTAEEELYEEAANEIGQAYLLKTAGEISDEEFEEYAEDVLDKTASFSSTLRGVGKSLGRFGRRMTGRQTFGDKLYYATQPLRSGINRYGKSIGRFGRRVMGRQTFGDKARDAFNRWYGA